MLIFTPALDLYVSHQSHWICDIIHYIYWTEVDLFMTREENSSPQSNMNEYLWRCLIPFTLFFSPSLSLCLYVIVILSGRELHQIWNHASKATSQRCRAVLLCRLRWARHWFFVFWQSQCVWFVWLRERHRTYKPLSVACTVGIWFVIRQSECKIS